MIPAAAGLRTTQRPNCCSSMGHSARPPPYVVRLEPAPILDTRSKHEQFVNYPTLRDGKPMWVRGRNPPTLPITQCHDLLERLPAPVLRRVLPRGHLRGRRRREGVLECSAAYDGLLPAFTGRSPCFWASHPRRAHCGSRPPRPLSSKATASGTEALDLAVIVPASRLGRLVPSGLRRPFRLIAALDLVRDQPFKGVNPRRHVWAMRLQQVMTVAIGDVAAELTRLLRAIQHDEPTGLSRSALGRSALGSPGSRLTGPL